MIGDRPTKKLVPTSWRLVHESEQAQLVEQLVLGKQGLQARLQLAATAIVGGQKPLAEKQLRQAAVLLAIVRQLGWEAEGAQREIELQAHALGCEVVNVE